MAGGKSVSGMESRCTKCSGCINSRAPGRNIGGAAAHGRTCEGQRWDKVRLKWAKVETPCRSLTSHLIRYNCRKNLSNSRFLKNAIAEILHANSERKRIRR